MKKNPLALTVYSRTMKAANDDGSSGATHPTAASSRAPLSERTGWDPFEVWRTRILPRADRDTHRDR